VAIFWGTSAATMLFSKSGGAEDKIWPSWACGSGKWKVKIELCGRTERGRMAEM